MARLQQSVSCVERIVEENRTTYGINTGFGLLASTRIAREDLENPATFHRAVTCSRCRVRLPMTA
ncbi:Histidine ammonia-lyase [Serratia fonticola]|uniref:Histidine ammonia-lyase n=1 Tax=Serratia fonticola TaxID=47917 RepID=A0A4U9WG16_SERFO|nr:Histidine ammonia-lyase [Serratia fonticola]